MPFDIIPYGGLAQIDRGREIGARGEPTTLVTNDLYLRETAGRSVALDWVRHTGLTITYADTPPFIYGSEADGRGLLVRMGSWVIRSNRVVLEADMKKSGGTGGVLFAFYAVAGDDTGLGAPVYTQALSANTGTRAGATTTLNTELLGAEGDRIAVLAYAQPPSGGASLTLYRLNVREGQSVLT